MADNPYLALIEGLNSTDDPSAATSASSPEDYAAELLLWTNAEFTFDMPPGLGIFETDSGFEDLAAANTVSSYHSTGTSTATTAPQHLQHQQDALLAHQFALQAQAQAHHHQQQQHQQHQQTLQQSLDFLNMSQATAAVASSSQAETKPLSLLERSRQRNPLNEDKSEQSQPQPQPQPQPQSQSQQQVDDGAILTVKPSSLLDANAATTTSTISSDLSATAFKDTSLDSQQDSSSTLLSAADSFSKDDPDYASKVAAEEDKRRRNTAASARFRQKKKLREQALEQTAHEQTERAEKLESRVRELEMEVRWLRGLIVEKDSRLHEATVSLHDANKRIRLQEDE
ncbi:hypothetical protein EDD11_009188 [Mortierella claussenii]|nr:hypothetical protein EDD11_009188 [Mortierella claussenii]